MQIEVYQDTACPWCRIGKRHLALALERWPEPVEVRYRTFFLNSTIPPEGYEFKPYMLAKGGGQIALEDFFSAPRRAGANVGLTFNFEQIEAAPNTLLSHELIALAPDDLKETVIDAIYKAYFQDGRDIGKLDVLTAIAAECGMDADAAAEALQNHTMREQVEAEAERAHQLGITGVPFFVIDGRYAFSGAQPPDLIYRVLQQVAAETAGAR
jgi:predicted DsbA family dithiol-disulfide isomerase